MRRTLIGSFQDLIIFDRFDDEPGAVYQDFLDEQSALCFLQGFAGSSFNMTMFRSIVEEKSAHFALPLSTDQEIMSGISRLVASGNLKLAEAPIFPNNEIIRTAPKAKPADKPVEESAKPPAPAPAPVAPTTWVEFLVQDDSEPPETVPGVTIKVKMADDTVETGSGSGGPLHFKDLVSGRVAIEDIEVDDGFWEFVGIE